MSAPREVTAPPALAGFEFLEVLGSGGFADVFLYQQLLPRRRVAVKVLRADQLRAGSVDAFTGEANAMAKLSTHPSIVTIYQAGVSDDGRPYLVMEFCPKVNLQVRYRREALGVAEALRVGIQIAGAVETSHRAGILHRDIKPANILVTEYNRPSLTDFGIAAATSADESGPVGMSIPWSPPESFMSPSWSGASSDVYGLAATIYTLLAGRSPFQLPAGSSSVPDAGTEVISRIMTLPVPSLSRPDVPTSLEAALVRGLSKRPQDRHASMLEFARVLQKVQIELSLAVTPLDVPDELVGDLLGGGAAEEPDADDADRTRVRGVVRIDPSGSAPAGAAAVPADPGAMPGVASIDPAGLGAAGGAGASVDADEPVRDRPRRVASIVGAALGLTAVVGVTLAIVLGAGAGGEASPRVSAAPAPVDAIIESDVPTPTDLVGVMNGATAVFTWTNPAPETGDLYLWSIMVAGQDGAVHTVTEPTVTVPRGEEAGPAVETCVAVSVRRADGRSSGEAATACASPAGTPG